MPGEQIGTTNKPYLSIVKGTWRQKVDKNVQGAILREYELSNGLKGSKYELKFINWTGIIKDISFNKSEFGTVCRIELDDAILSINTETKFFSDLASKLFNADLTKPITFHPYLMVVDNKTKRGMSLKQDNEKLVNYFYDYEKKKNLHGFPEVDKSKLGKKSYWQIYFLEVEEFLVEKINELRLKIGKTASTPVQENDNNNEIELDDLPF